MEDLIICTCHMNKDDSSGCAKLERESWTGKLILIFQIFKMEVIDDWTRL